MGELEGCADFAVCAPVMLSDSETAGSRWRAVSGYAREVTLLPRVADVLPKLGTRGSCSSAVLGTGGGGMFP